MQGLIFSDNQDFALRFQPLSSELKRLWWFVDFQSGPFSSLWTEESEANQRRFQAIHFSVSECENTSSQVWRPGTLPELSSHICFGEWSYLLGFDASQEQVQGIVANFVAARSFTSPDFFEAVRYHAQIYILDVDEGWLEVYSPRPEWLELLQARWPQAKFVDSLKWRST